MIEIITKLAQLAGKYPDFRFMQIVENILEHKHECHYHMRDSDFMAKLKAFEDRIGAGDKPSRCVYTCSFCKKDQDNVEKLLVGPKVYICNECVDLCNEILDEEYLEPKETPAND